MTFFILFNTFLGILELHVFRKKILGRCSSQWAMASTHEKI
jgi:hypothetical protein